MEQTTQQSHELEPGPSNKVKGKQARWMDREIPGIPAKELDIQHQEQLLDEIQRNKKLETLPQEKDSGYDWVSNRLEGDEKFSSKQQQQELDAITAGRHEDRDEQQAILASFQSNLPLHSTP